MGRESDGVENRRRHLGIRADSYLDRYPVVPVGVDRVVPSLTFVEDHLSLACLFGGAAWPLLLRKEPDAVMPRLIGWQDRGATRRTVRLRSDESRWAGWKWASTEPGLHTRQDRPAGGDVDVHAVV